jgi:hypothetical protein
MFDLILDVMNGFSARSVQSSRWDGAIFLIIPGTSCLATIVLSLRDKRHSTAEALLKLAFYGLKPSAKFLMPRRGAIGLKSPIGNAQRASSSAADISSNLGAQRWLSPNATK